MPQVFQVLRCFKCLVFQVHQTKKSNKWQCKMCGEKQSVKRHYGIGTGMECRLHVQKLNKLRGDKQELNENVADIDQKSFSSDEIHEENSPKRNTTQIKVTENSKWSAFFDEDSINDLDLEDQKNIHVNSYQPRYSRSKPCNKRRKVLTNPQNDNIPEETFENIFLTQCNYNSTYTINQNENLITTNRAYTKKIDYADENKVNTKHITHLVNKNVKVYQAPRNTTSNSKYFTPAKSLTTKNSKWSNYLDESVELSNMSNDDIFIYNQDNSLQTSQDKENIKETTNQCRVTQEEFVENEAKNIKFIELECSKENLKKHNIIDTTTDLEPSDNQPNEKDIFLKESTRALFSLADDSELDSILDV